MMLVQRASQEEVFFTSQILTPDVKFNDNLIGWMLATQCWNKARVYSTVTLVLTTLCWRQHHNIVHQA